MNHDIKLIKNRFHQNHGSIVIGTLGLVLGASTSGKDNIMESFLVMPDMVKKHISRDFGPFLA